MRYSAGIAALVLALLSLHCQSDSGGSRGIGGVRLPEKGTLFVKVFNDDPAATGPTDVTVSLDGQKVLDRVFTMDEKSYDGQYQVRLPKGRHVLEASSQQNAVFTSKAFTLKDKAFIQIYVTEDKKLRLTPGSRRSLKRLVIKRMREARGVYSDPALWMILPAPQPSPATSDAAKRELKNRFKAQAAEKIDNLSTNNSKRGKP